MDKNQAFFHIKHPEKYTMEEKWAAKSLKNNFDKVTKKEEVWN